MNVTNNISSERVGVDEAYERFFDGFYNLGRPSDLFQRTVVLSPPPREPVKPCDDRDLAGVTPAAHR